MSNRLILICHTVLCILDILFILYAINQPLKDRVHGGLGQGIAAMFALGVIVLLMLYGSAFLLVYYRQWFTAAKIMWWLLASTNIVIMLWLLLIWVNDRL